MMQKVVPDTELKVMKEIVSEQNGKNKEAEPGIIIVLHPLQEIEGITKRKISKNFSQYFFVW